MTSNVIRHKSSVAMLIIDVINHFEFSDGRHLLKQAAGIAKNIARLKARARRHKIPILYVNDNFGQWRSDARKLLQYCVNFVSSPHRTAVPPEARRIITVPWSTSRRSNMPGFCRRRRFA